MAPHYHIIGRPLPARVDGLGKVTGVTQYADDLFLPRMLYGKLLRSPHPHANIVRIDTQKAAALPGVLAIITGADLLQPFSIMPVNQDEHALAPDKVRYVGDPVAAVAAVDEETAEAALHHIEVEYDVLRPIMSIAEALQHPDDRIHSYTRVGNIHRVAALEFGDVDDGFAAADYTREDTFFFEGNTHLPMEQHAAVAHYTPDGKLTLWSSTQTPHYVHRALAAVLGLPASRIRVIATPVGGGFGGKSDPFSHEFCAAKLSMLTGRPVKFCFTREEVFYAHRGRHPVLMWVRTGVQRDGAITAMHFKTFIDGGGYSSYGVATTYYTGALQTVTYHIPAYRFEGLRVFTNKPPCGPKRGHGTPQPRYALEVHLDKIAEDLGLSAVDIRRPYVVKPFSRTVNHLRVTSCGLGECIDAVIARSAFLDKVGKLPYGKGIGFACSSYLSGAGLPIYWNDMPHSGVTIQVDRSGGVAVLCGAIDIGQGSDSVLVFTVAEELGLHPSDVHLVTADTAITPVDLGSYSSRVTFMAGNAAIAAARKLRAQLFTVVAEALDVPAKCLDAADGRIFCVDAPDTAMPFAEAAQRAEARFGTLSASGSYKPPELTGKFKGQGVGPSPAYSYTAAVVEIDVDPDTGWITVDKVWIAHDIGKAINPYLVEGQIEGSVYMALGEVLMEEQTFRKGVHKIPSLLEYKSPTFLEMPPVDTVLIESLDPEGPYGAKEAGQGPLLPVIPAVTNAVYDAVGVRIDDIPITPDKILKALDLKAKRQEPRLGPRGIPVFDFPPPRKVDVPDEWLKVLPIRQPDARKGRSMLRLPPFTYLAPSTLSEAVRLLADQSPDTTMLVAGGTDLYPNMKRRQFEPRQLIGLRHVRDLQQLTGTAQYGLTIGAGMTLTQLSQHPEVVAAYPALATAAALVSTPQLRNMGTIGGNLCVDTRCNYYNQTYWWRKAIGFCMKKDGDTCWVAPGSSRCWAVSSSDTAPVMIALKAHVRLVSTQGERVLPVHDLYRDDGIRYLGKRHDEILTHILLPPADGWRMHYFKLRRREAFDFPILGVAAALRLAPDGTCIEARLVLGAVTSTPLVATDAAATLIGQQLTPEVIDAAAAAAFKPAKPLDNTDLLLSYRKKMVRVHVARTLRQLADSQSPAL